MHSLKEKIPYETHPWKQAQNSDNPAFPALAERRKEGTQSFCLLWESNDKYKTCKDKGVCEGTPEVIGEVFTVENVMEVQGKLQVSICKTEEQIYPVAKPQKEF